jgi:hypothetical protein
VGQMSILIDKEVSRAAAAPSTRTGVRFYGPQPQGPTNSFAYPFDRRGSRQATFGDYGES